RAMCYRSDVLASVAREDRLDGGAETGTGLRSGFLTEDQLIRLCEQFADMRFEFRFRIEVGGCRATMLAQIRLCFHRQMKLVRHHLPRLDGFWLGTGDDDLRLVNLNLLCQGNTAGATFSGQFPG